ncbi:MAG TPA: hypothetical protein VM260_25265 [Pirellula sp.]|nr:hypothetical protein [Pirellula sp.]
MAWINPKQLDEILSRHGPALVLYARQWSPLPDDALQEALCDLVQTDVAPNDIIAWLYKVIRCKAMNLSRSERRRNGYQRNAAEQRDEWFENRHKFAEEINELENHLKQLPELGREIVVADRTILCNRQRTGCNTTAENAA